jgi:hypothetical protein
MRQSLSHPSTDALRGTLQTHSLLPSRAELDSLVKVADSCRKTLVLPIILFAIESGHETRRNPGHQMADQEKRYLTIPAAKNALPRELASLLQLCSFLGQEKGMGNCRYWSHPMLSDWPREAGLEIFHFHDLRHEATSRFAEMRLNTPELPHQWR